MMKIDLSKAYDRVYWNFLERVLINFDFPTQLIKLIMFCVASIEMVVSWNGRICELFFPSRSLRQGCPISPYLFVLVMEKLGATINSKVDNNE